MYHDHSNEPCPKCGGETHQESANIGVGVIFGPRGCIECAWSEDTEYDLSDGRCPIDDKGGVFDQFGMYHPPGSTVAAAYRLAAKEGEEG